MRLHTVDIPEDRLAELCRRAGVLRLSVFGSILRSDFSPESDVDVLVEFRPEADVSLFDLGGLLMDLRELLGREVHLLTPSMLPARFREQVLGTARRLYAA
ncbi:MAG: nucleotidyltransferase family protein [Phycisphaerales bacterium]|nr:nucleotidyltransferase family protein [Phycisphaerales bacterium]